MKATSTLARRRGTLCGIALCGITFGFAAIHPAAAQAPGSSGSAAAALPYAREYPAIPYTKMPTDNAIARLQSRIDRGEGTCNLERNLR